MWLARFLDPDHRGGEQTGKKDQVFREMHLLKSVARSKHASAKFLSSAVTGGKLELKAGLIIHAPHSTKLGGQIDIIGAV